MPFKRIESPKPSNASVDRARAIQTTHLGNRRSRLSVPPQDPRANIEDTARVNAATVTNNDVATVETLLRPARGQKKAIKRLPEKPDDYVGKYYPPKKNRWQKGVSGNPAGRKKKVDEPIKDLRSLIIEVLGEPVPVSMPSGERMMNAVQIALRKAREHAAKGESWAVKAVLDNWRAAVPEVAKPKPGASEPAVLNDEDKTILAEILELFEMAKAGVT